MMLNELELFMIKHDRRSFFSQKERKHMTIDELEKLFHQCEAKQLFNRIRLELLISDEWKTWRRINVKKALRKSCQNYQDLKEKMSEYESVDLLADLNLQPMNVDPICFFGKSIKPKGK